MNSINTVDIAAMQRDKGTHLIARVPRRDVAGKSILRSDEKYYAVDHGLRTAMGFDNLSDVEIVLENIVHTELRSRGYKIQIR